MAKQGRYMVSQKLSDYQIEKILRSFAKGLTAKEALERLASRGKPSRASGTVYNIYDLTRKRLLEIGFFPDPADYAQWINSTPELQANFPFSKTAQRIADQSDRLRGASDESVRYHVAEMIFRAENTAMTPDTLYHEIRTALRLTGPLNRPPRDVILWHERHYINVCQRAIVELRAMRNSSRDGHRSLIAGYEVLIADAKKRLRKRLRDRASPAQSTSGSDD